MVLPVRQEAMEGEAVDAVFQQRPEEEPNRVVNERPGQRHPRIHKKGRGDRGTENAKQADHCFQYATASGA